MPENQKKDETQVIPDSNANPSAQPVISQVPEQKKTCPALYPSQPHTSDK